MRTARNAPQDAVTSADPETVSLGSNRNFFRLIGQSRTAWKTKGGLSAAGSQAAALAASVAPEIASGEPGFETIVRSRSDDEESLEEPEIVRFAHCYQGDFTPISNPCPGQRARPADLARSGRRGST
jgi:hypothetical protein